jgi:hypothetical protein
VRTIQIEPPLSAKLSRSRTVPAAACEVAWIRRPMACPA